MDRARARLRDGRRQDVERAEELVGREGRQTVGHVQAVDLVGDDERRGLVHALEVHRHIRRPAGRNGRDVLVTDRVVGRLQRGEPGLPSRRGRGRRALRRALRGQEGARAAGRRGEGAQGGVDRSRVLVQVLVHDVVLGDRHLEPGLLRRTGHERGVDPRSEPERALDGDEPVVLLAAREEVAELAVVVSGPRPVPDAP